MTNNNLRNFLLEVSRNSRLQNYLIKLRNDASSRCDGGIDFEYIDDIISSAKQKGYNICRKDLASENTDLIDIDLNEAESKQLLMLSGGIHRCMVAPLRCGLAGCNQFRNNMGQIVSEKEREDFLEETI